MLTEAVKASKPWVKGQRKTFFFIFFYFWYSQVWGSKMKTENIKMKNYSTSLIMFVPDSYISPVCLKHTQWQRDSGCECLHACLVSWFLIMPDLSEVQRTQWEILIIEWITHQGLVFSLQESENHRPAVVSMLRAGEVNTAGDRERKRAWQTENKMQKKQIFAETRTIHFLNQVALTSSKARKWTGSRSFSERGEAEPCSWWKHSKEKVLSITSSMYLQQRWEGYSRIRWSCQRWSHSSAHFSGWRIQKVVTSFWKSFSSRIWARQTHMRSEKSDDVIVWLLTAKYLFEETTDLRSVDVHGRRTGRKAQLVTQKTWLHTFSCK